MKNNDMSIVDIRKPTKEGSVKAYVDIEIGHPRGSILVPGFVVIEKNGRPPWVAFPSKPGRMPGKYFPVIEFEGELRETIVETIQERYAEWKANQ